MSRDPRRALAARVAPEWVTSYDPERAASGYTLALFERKTPILLDMNGRLVHSWPGVEARSRVRLLEDGSLLTIALGGSKVQRFDWGGRLIWEFASPDRLPHHDLVRLANGNVLVIVLEPESRTDDLLEVDPTGEVVWEWSSRPALRGRIDARRDRKPRSQSFTHFNSVQELPENRWYDAGDERFRPGNLLVSARNLDALLVIDRATGDVVWSLEEGLDQQHEALMLPRSIEPAGGIMVFDNRPRERRSAVVVFDPHDGSVLWSFAAAGFFSATKGAEQPLPGGNVLVASSRGRRVFEVTRRGDVVWQWAPPFELQRPQRYAYDYAPPLAALAPPRERAVVGSGERFVDRELYDFVRELRRHEVSTRSGPRSVLPSPARCRSVVLPAAPRIEVAYGHELERAAAEALRFSVSAQLGDRPAVGVLEDRLPASAPAWSRRGADLPPGDTARICVGIETDADGEWRPVKRGVAAFWESVEIHSATAPRPVDGGDEVEAPSGRPSDDLTDELTDELTEEQLEERRRHLEALGYID